MLAASDAVKATGALNVDWGSVRLGNTTAAKLG